MKIKHGLMITIFLAVICVALRTAQYFYAIDGAGYFTDTDMATVLKISLYAVLALSAVFALIIMIFADRELAEFGSGVSTVGSGIIYLLLACFLMFVGGVAFGNVAARGEMDILGFLAIPAAVYFADAGICMLKGVKPGAVCAFFGLFPPIYVFASAITEFFDSFKHANDSGGKIDMLVICATALFMVSLVAVSADASVSKARFAAVSSLCCVLCSTRAIADIIAVISGKIQPDTEVLTSVIFQTLLIPLTVIVLAGLGTEKSDTDAVPEGEVVKEMEIYIDEIPDREKDDNE